MALRQFENSVSCELSRKTRGGRNSWTKIRVGPDPGNPSKVEKGKRTATRLPFRSR